MKILVADDDPTSRRVLEAMLGQGGYQVVSVSDGNEAWDVLRGEDPPRLILLDWMMPGMDGLELCRRLRNSNKLSLFFVILVTAKGRKEDIVEGLGAGANDYIVKPFNREELRARVKVGERVIKLQSSLSARVEELQEALSHIKTLQGILPICMYCHKIRDDKEAWARIESYIEKHSEARFSHSLCPECLEKHYLKSK